MIKIELTSSEERYRLERLSKQGRGKESFRANIILLNNADISPPDIAKALNISHQTVLSWLKKYRDRGIDGLKDKEHEIGIPLTLGILQKLN